MSAKFLQPGQLLTDGRRIYRFVRRYRAANLQCWNVLQCDDYAGLNGPTDKGLCEMTDQRLVRQLRKETA